MVEAIWWGGPPPRQSIGYSKEQIGADRRKRPVEGKVDSIRAWSGITGGKNGIGDVLLGQLAKGGIGKAPRVVIEDAV